ncbi:hypothetical protein L6164_031795 [Bauhinia variegata]|uniref:Uncharacterized protein n=1 Tax=Bauhinia variegata TaxID=167791 RepID=A0ACB9KLJ6_BAUVA|nr:hypothetical protein L6164_031795 [Bauhinia variegata]
MPSLKMKSKVSTSCIRERRDLIVSPKSNRISKKPCSKITISAKLETTIHDRQDVSSTIPLSSKDLENGGSIEHKDFVEEENSEFPHQQLFSLNSSALVRMEPSNCYTANLETIFSPAFKPIDVHAQLDTANDAGSISDTDMPALGADEGDERISICGYETCDVSDFYISDLIFTSLPFDGEGNEANCYISDYKSAESTALFDAADRYMVLPALEDDVKNGSTSDVRPCEEVMTVRENTGLYSAMSQIRSSNQESDALINLDKAECFDPQSYIKNLPELSAEESNFQPTVPPKESQRRKSVTLVLDLDETLVHSKLEQCDDADFTFTVFFNIKEYTVYVKQRPYLHTFLERVAEMFEVVIFTASQSIYAKQLLDILDPDGKLICHRVYRESCVFLDGNYTKDLTVLGVDLAKVAIVDNSPQVFRLQVNNGIPIKSWFDDPLDCALLSLLPFLETLADADDVRPIIAKRFGNSA